ncbi:hypothetical protein QMG83_05215 [Salinibacterium sp. G-O1]|nr:hypothetical protein [Salinibacterium sp. G-O1]MDJ0334617.1 hypothetical protein [Salinibacterium sp. G-O1]
MHRDPGRGDAMDLSFGIVTVALSSAMCSSSAHSTELLSHDYSL